MKQTALRFAFTNTVWSQSSKSAAIYPYEDPVALVCNEEGKREGLPLNRALRDEDGDIYSFLKLRNAAAEISEGGCVLNGSLH